MEQQKDFHHPFTPYRIQIEFMQAVYTTIKEGKIGIFESPTGTGKSLSLICGALTWLREHQAAQFSHGLDDDENSGEPAWILEQIKEQRRQDALRERRKLEEKLERIRQKERREKEQYIQGRDRVKRKRIDAKQESTAKASADDYLLDEYESDGEQKERNVFDDSGYSSSTLTLMKKLGLERHQTDPDSANAIAPEVKIFYCSRTHSQLSQFSSELRRVRIPSFSDSADQSVRHLTLGSRKNLCINPSVQALGAPTAINERCLELQQSSTPKEKRCRFVPDKDSQPLVAEFRDHALAEVRDIEDLARVGKKIAICPFYASRAAIAPSEIVTMPYPLMLQDSAREALGVELEGNVVVIDEAHNLMDAISSIHSASISLQELFEARTQLTTYLQKFLKRLKGKNRIYLTQLIRVLDSIAACLRDKSGSKVSEGVIHQQALLKGNGVDQVDLFKLMNYLQESRLARKVDGYTGFVETEADEPKGANKRSRTSTPVLMRIQSFLHVLTNPSAEGRFFYNRGTEIVVRPGQDSGPNQMPDIVLKYLLLNPSHFLLPIIENARAIILAGGTMSPMADVINHLFPSVPSSRFSILSCGHVIPSENLLVLPVSTGSQAGPLDFTYGKRDLVEMMNEVGQTILHLIRQIPDGVVVFAPSYQYLAKLIQHWTRSGLYNLIEQEKQVFTESKESPSVDALLSAFGEAIRPLAGQAMIGKGRGALLFSVVNGKMSEGINFSDDLGRAVIMIGLPFPNAQNAEWQARLEYVEGNYRKQQILKTSNTGNKTQSFWETNEITSAKDASRAFYENTCMRAVNQSIGRAIRHKGDYAAIILLDRRYATERIQRKLPAWIRSEIKVSGDLNLPFKQVEESIATFFEQKRKQGRVG